MTDQRQRRLTLQEVIRFGRGPAYTVGLLSISKAAESDRLACEALAAEIESAELAEAARALAELGKARTNSARDEAKKEDC